MSSDDMRSIDGAKIDDFERLRPEELNQQNIEALVAENNLEQVKERSVHSKETPQFMSGAQSLETSPSYLGQNLPLGTEKGHEQLLSPPMMLLNMVHIAQRGLVQPLIEMLQSADVWLREMSSFALGRLA
uniref:Uncharacterized protein n=1 Tax=Vitis vinifera TaxID=29760 RepID=F6HJJ0_VITVI